MAVMLGILARQLVLVLGTPRLKIQLYKAVVAEVVLSRVVMLVAVAVAVATSAAAAVLQVIGLMAVLVAVQVQIMQILGQPVM